MENQKYEDMDEIEGLLIFGGMRYKRIAPSVILVLSTDKNEFSETDIQWIKEAFNSANRNQKLRRYNSKQIIIIYEETGL